MTRKEDLSVLRSNLKSGEYDGVDIMKAWLAIDELIELRDWRSKAFDAYPNIDIDIEQLED